MKFISHRGNLEGKEPEENTLKKIIYCVNNDFDVEIDVWSLNNELFLGHDFGQHYVHIETLMSLKNKLWIHCKNIEALHMLSNKDLNIFFHNTDDCTLTSKGLIWTYPGKQLTSLSVCVLPENANYSINNLNECYGICSDQIKKYKGLL
jgi:hypothetical protein